MVKPRKVLETSAPWRGHLEEEDEEKMVYKEGQLSVTRNDSASTMHLHHNNNKNQNYDSEPDFLTQFDSQLRYAFRRNYRFLQNVFSIDTMVKPLPPAMAENVSRNLSFFGRIFTQFSDPEGISNAQKSLGLGKEDKLREVR